MNDDEERQKVREAILKHWRKDESNGTVFDPADGLWRTIEEAVDASITRRKRRERIGDGQDFYELNEEGL